MPTNTHKHTQTTASHLFEVRDDLTGQIEVDEEQLKTFCQTIKNGVGLAYTPAHRNR
jgi:hypothetical protein